MSLAIGPILVRLAGMAVILVGVYIIVINKKQAQIGIDFQRSIGSPFSGTASYWMFRACCVLGGLIGIWCGVLLLAGYH